MSVPPANHAVAYLMEHDGEGRRLERKTKHEETLSQLRMCGLSRGSIALDAGAGTGAVARVMAEVVGPAGSVVALDASEKRIREGTKLANGLSNLRFVHGDVRVPPLAESSFDFVWCRFLLQHVPDPKPVVESLLRLTRPGGRLVVGDLDGHGLWHYPMSARFEGKLRELATVMKGHQDPFMGRKLFHLCFSLGIEDIRVQVLPYHLYPGAASDSDIENWSTKLEVARPAMEGAFGSQNEYEDFVSEFLGMLRDPGVFTYSSLMLVSGTKPDGDDRGSTETD